MFPKEPRGEDAHNAVELLSDVTAEQAKAKVGSGAANQPGGSDDEASAMLTPATSSTSFDVKRRSLWPMLALMALMVAGLVLSSVQSDDGDDEARRAAEQPPATVTIESEADQQALADEPSVEQLGGLTPDDRLYLVPIPTSTFSAFESNVLVVGADEFIGRDFGFRMFAGAGTSTRLNPGVDRHPLLSTNQGLVVVGLGQIFLQDADLALPAQEIGQGISVLAGPNDNSIWILGTAERTAELYDLSGGLSIAEFNLEDKGRPLASAADGIILADRKPSPANDFQYWEPIHGLLELEGTDDVHFLGANRSTAVFGTDAELIIFDLSDLTTTRRLELVDDKLTGIRVQAEIGEIWGSSLSPDGSLLAVTVLTPLPEPNVIKLIDTETGETRDTIQSALEFQYRWSGPDTLVYMRPSWPAAILSERDSHTGTDRQMVWLSSLAWWYAIEPRPPS